MMGYDGGQETARPEWKCEGNVEPRNTNEYYVIFGHILGVLKKLGNMMIGIEVTNPHAVWKKLVSKSW